MWTAFGLLFGLAVPFIALVLTVCVTVTLHHRRMIRARMDEKKFEANRETEKFLMVKQMWDEQAELIREGKLTQPDPAWQEAIRRLGKG